VTGAITGAAEGYSEFIGVTNATALKAPSQSGNSTLAGTLGVTGQSSQERSQATLNSIGDQRHRSQEHPRRHRQLDACRHTGCDRATTLRGRLGSSKRRSSPWITNATALRHPQHGAARHLQAHWVWAVPTHRGAHGLFQSDVRSLDVCCHCAPHPRRHRQLHARLLWT
jgi:hypothetical protein